MQKIIEDNVSRNGYPGNEFSSASCISSFIPTPESGFFHLYPAVDPRDAKVMNIEFKTSASSHQVIVAAINAGRQTRDRRARTPYLPSLISLIAAASSGHQHLAFISRDLPRIIHYL